MPDLWMDVDAALAEVPVNLMPLIDDTDFKSIEASVAYDAAGMALKWNFVTTAGAMSQIAVTPTSGGNYDWASQGNGLYSIEIPASGGASINNDTEGVGWFSGVATGVLPWRGPTIGFRAAGLNDALIDGAYSSTRGLAGTALPNAAADGAGGLPISDAGGLDMDAILSRIGTPSNLGGGATLSQNLSDIEAQTDDIGAAGAGLTAADDAILIAIAALNNLSAAQVNAEVDTALADINLDHLVKSAVDTDFATTVHLNSVIGQLADNGTSASFDRTTDSLEAITDKIGTPSNLGGGATLSQNLSDIEAQTDDIGAAGAGLTAADDAILIAIAALNNLSAAQVNAEVDTALADINLDHLVKSAVDTDFATTVHLNSVIGQLADNGTSASFDRTTDSLEAITDKIGTPSNLGGGATLSQNLSDIEAQTDDIGAAGAGLTAADDAILSAIAALNNLSAAQVNAEVDTALADINLDHLVKSAVDTDFATTVHLNSVIGQLADNGTSASFDRTTDSLEAVRDRGDAAWITATGFSTLDAAGVRMAVGLASANLDTQLGDLPTAVENADALLDRNMATGADSGSTTVRTVRQALRVLRNKHANAAGTLTVYKEDDSTSSWTAAVTTDAAAEPITAIDPAGP